jgi:hypothetical protein
MKSGSWFIYIKETKIKPRASWRWKDPAHYEKVFHPEKDSNIRPLQRLLWNNQAGIT